MINNLKNIKFQNSKYWRNFAYKTVIHLNNFQPDEDYLSWELLPKSLKLVQGSKNDKSWYHLHFPEKRGWTESVCRLERDILEPDYYIGIIHQENHSILISLQLKENFQFSLLRAYGFYSPKMLRLITA